MRIIDLCKLASLAHRKARAGSKHQTGTVRMMSGMFENACREIPMTSGIRRMVRRFGFQRGQRIAEKVKLRGLPLTVENLIENSDIPSDGYKVKAAYHGDELRIDVIECPYLDELEKLGALEYAPMYCEEIDMAIAEGYNPDINLRHEHAIPGCCCRMTYSGG